MIDETAEESVITFGYIPRLGPGVGTLMPRTGGQPGVTYAQVCTHHTIKAKRAGLGPVKDAEPYIIEGPDGHAEVVLMCEGEPIKNASPNSGARECNIDREIYILTGYEDPDGEKPKDKTKPLKAGQSGQGDEGVQARQPGV